MTHAENRRTGKYHTGVPTVVVGVRMEPQLKADLQAKAEAAGWDSVSGYVEWLIETQAMRKR